MAYANVRMELKTTVPYQGGLQQFVIGGGQELHGHIDTCSMHVHPTRLKLMSKEMNQSISCALHAKL